jgi:hypothetical protein
MSDGREERRDEEQRRQWEKEREREDRIERGAGDRWQPERKES